MLPDVPRRVGPVTGLGISRVDFDFKIFASSNVLVIRTSKAGVDKTLKEGEDYTVTWDEDQTANIGGYITLDEFLTDGESVTILSNVAYTQELDLHAEGDFNPNDINVNFDRTEAQIQQLKEKLSRAAVAPASSGMEGEEYGEILLENSTKSGEYAAQAQAAAEKAQAAADIATSAQENLDASTDIAENAAKVASNSATAAAQFKLDSEAAAVTATEAAEVAKQAAFSYRYCATATVGGTVNTSDVVPETLIKVGDHVMNSSGQIFRVLNVGTSTCELSGIVTTISGPQGLKGDSGSVGPQGSAGATFTPAVSTEGEISWTNNKGLTNPAPVNIRGPKGERGERGLQGSPGPAGSVGPQGPMGSSPWATAFGQFRIDGADLKLDYVGLDTSADFSINTNGELTVTVTE